LKKKLAQAQLEVMRKGGVDIDALAREARELRPQLGGATKQPLPELPGLQPEIPSGPVHLPYILVRPPYSYDWSSTGYVDYSPGTLSAYANRESGTLGFDDTPDAYTSQAYANYASYAGGRSGHLLEATSCRSIERNDHRKDI
jgi:hypothetical protein